MMQMKWNNSKSADAVALIAIKLVTISLGFVVTRLLSQQLSTHDYGTYSQLLLVVSTVSSLTILGMADGVNYFYCSEQDVRRRESYMATLVVMQCMVSTAAGILIMLLRGWISAGFDNPDTEKLMFVAAALPLLQNLVFMFQILLVSEGKAKIIAVRNLIVSVVRLAVVVLVMRLVQNIAVILITTLLLDIGQLAVFVQILRNNRCVIRLSKTDFQLCGQILQYCLPMAVSVMLNSLSRDCDKYLIGFLTDTQTLAVYTNASKPLPFDIVMTSFCTVLLPVITRLVAEKQNQTAGEVYRLYLEVAYVSTIILCCAAMSAAPQLMELLYSEKYLPGLSVFCVYILVDAVRFTNMTLILSAAGQTKKLMFAAVGALAANVLLNFVLFRAVGVIGPAAATLLTTIGVGIVMLHMNAKALQTTVRHFFDRRYLLVFLLQNLAATVLFVQIRTWLQAKGMHYFGILVMVGGAYCVCMVLLNGRRLLNSMKQMNRSAGKL